MKLVLHGTGGYHPNARRQTSCYELVEAGLVLDAGTAFHRLRGRIGPAGIDVLLSHAHLDHVVGLTFLFDVLHDAPARRIRVHGAADKLAAIREHLLAEPLFPAPLPIDWHPLEGSSLILGSARITWFPLRHPGGSLGYRFDWPDRSLAFVTDTTADEHADYVERIRGVDLLVHECNFRDGQESLAELTGHSCTSAVARVARRAAVGRLVLVHFNALDESDDPIDLPAARRLFPPTHLGSDGLTLDF